MMHVNGPYGIGFFNVNNLNLNNEAGEERFRALLEIAQICAGRNLPVPAIKFSATKKNDDATT
jgi:hypothetical protein